MIIKFLLIALFLSLMVWFVTNRNASTLRAWQKLLFIGLIILAIMAIIYPDTLTSIAKKVGVGRGADLLLYGLAFAFILNIVHQYVKSKDDQKRLAKVVRKIALNEVKNK